MILWLILAILAPVRAADVTPKCFIKPCEIRGDFDGDGRSDRAVLVQNKAGQKGIEVRFAGGKTALLGAGVEVGSGGDDFNWMDAWRLHQGGISAGDGRPGPRPKGDSLSVEKSDSASGILYWNGRRFEWAQQGD